MGHLSLNRHCAVYPDNRRSSRLPRKTFIVAAIGRQDNVRVLHRNTVPGHLLVVVGFLLPRFNRKTMREPLRLDETVLRSKKANLRVRATIRIARNTCSARTRF